MISSYKFYKVHDFIIEAKEAFSLPQAQFKFDGMDGDHAYFSLIVTVDDIQRIKIIADTLQLDVMIEYSHQQTYKAELRLELK